MISHPVLMLMTKTPVAGQVKTRFLSHVSAQTAALIALEMILDTVATATRSWPGVVQLLIRSDSCNPALEELAKSFNLEIVLQHQGDLGQKMGLAICDTLEQAPAAAVMGCDIPDISPAILELAHARLSEGCNIIGPSADGGFYFAGFSNYIPGIFDHIEWSTSTVFQTVLTRLRTNHRSQTVVLPCLNDIDHWDDFVELADRRSRYAKYLHT